MENPKSPRISASPPAEVNFLDEFFNPIWLGIVRSIRAKYPSLTKEIAEDLAGEILVKIVAHFDFQSLAGLTLTEKKKRLWAYIKAVRRGVTADFFKNHGPEIALPDNLSNHPDLIELCDFIGAGKEEQPVSGPLLQIRRALKELDPGDRKIVLLKAEGWTFPQIAEQSRNRVGTGTLRMRYSRALNQLRRYLRRGGYLT